MSSRYAAASPFPWAPTRARSAAPRPARWAFLRMTALLFAAAFVLSACQAYGYRSAASKSFYTPHGVNSYAFKTGSLGFRHGDYGFRRGGFGYFGGRHGFRRH